MSNLSRNNHIITFILSLSELLGKSLWNFANNLTIVHIVKLFIHIAVAGQRTLGTKERKLRSLLVTVVTINTSWFTNWVT